MSFTPAESHDSSLDNGFELADGQDNAADSIRLAEKTACERCRRRKIKCDRISPCAHCTKAQVQCIFSEIQKPVEKRQRILISSIFESRMENVSKKIDDLAKMVERLDRAELGNNTKYIPNQSPGTTSRLDVSFVNKRTDSNPKPSPHTAFVEKDSIDTSLFVHAIVATKHLAEALNRGEHPQSRKIALETSSSVETLQAVVDSQKRQPEANETSSPFNKPLQPGTTTRDLKLPPIAEVMACLRLAQDHPRIQISWPRDIRSVVDFTTYVIRVCSPGPADASDAELIIVYLGLYWLFSECSLATVSEEAQLTFSSQAQLCRDGLDTVLSNLSFYTPATSDYIFALYMAVIYVRISDEEDVHCLGFITRASLSALAAGYHSSAAMASDTLEEQNRKCHIFWNIYYFERSVALRLGRSSTIRDNEITIPEPDALRAGNSVGVHSDLVGLVKAGRVFGRLYEHLFSASAVVLSPDIRTSRAQALLTEWKQVMGCHAENQTRLRQTPEYLACQTLLDFVTHAMNAGDYAVLLAIYRFGLGRSTTSEGSLSVECTAAARRSLYEHTACINLLQNDELHSAYFDMWINGGMLLLPFVPFNIVFCNVVQTADPADLDILKTLVDALELLSQNPRFSHCSRELVIFKILHDVAARYIEIGLGPPPGCRPRCPRAESRCPEAVLLHNAEGQHQLDTSSSGLNFLPLNSVFEGQNWLDFDGIELDPLGTQLGNWFQDGSEMMDFLEES